MVQALYARLTGADPADDTGRTEARNGLIHLVSLTLTKTADGLIDPKLVLSWALNAVGSPAAFIGALVPIREAGALLPQLALARQVEAAPARRRFWSLGSALQGFAALGVAAAIAFLDGAAAGWGVVFCLVLFSLARAVCSVSYKDVLARSIPKRRRGSLTGAAASVAAGLVLAYGAALATGVIPLRPAAIAAAIAVGAGFWLVAAALFLRLDEASGAGEDAGGPDIVRLVRPIVTDAQLRLFVSARALLTATALAPPFLLLTSGQGQGGGLGQLGPLVLASSAASILSGWVWGRLSDRSSRLTLAVSAALAALVLGGAAAAGLLTGGLGGLAGAVGAIFAAQVAYEGVRAGRKLHLTDMATDDQRARYTALSNSLIGIVLLLGGTFGVISDLAGPAVVLAILAGLCAAAIPVALLLEEVQSEV